MASETRSWWRAGGMVCLCDGHPPVSAMFEEVAVLSIAEADALRRLKAAVEDDALMREYGSITIPAAVMLPAYRAALLKAMEAKP